MSWLDRLVGTWTGALTHVARAEPVAAVQHFEPVLEGRFLLHRWTYADPDFPDALGLLSSDRYHYFDVRGETRVFDVRGDDTGWSMLREGPSFAQRQMVQLVGPNRMEGSGEASRDGGATWEHDFRVSFERRA